MRNVCSFFFICLCTTFALLYISYVNFDDTELHPFLVTPNYTLHFQSFQISNSRSKPFNIIDMLKCTCRSNFTFFGILLLFIKYLTKSLYSDRWIFVPILINSKKIQKNVKFDLQAHFNISIKLNGLDRLFELCKHRV